MKLNMKKDSELVIAFNKSENAALLPKKKPNQDEWTNKNNKIIRDRKLR